MKRGSSEKLTSDPGIQPASSFESRNRFSAFLAKRPCLQDALIWSIPALIAAALLHAFIIYHTPLAFWTHDSPSFIKFADELLSSGQFSLEAKRRWVYPIFLLVPHALPGPTLFWVKLLQTVLSLCSLIALGYIVRKTFAAWKLLIVPATLIYALHPHFFFYTGQVLAESLGLDLIILSIAGWTAWLDRADSPTRFSPFLLFLTPIALFLLTKPAHRFVWPGLIVAFFLSGSWRWLRWPHLAALVVLALLTMTVGTQSVGDRLLYASTFPLTQLQTSKHAEYKRAVADFVKEARAELPRFAFAGEKYSSFIARPSRYPRGGELWAELDHEHKALKFRLYRDLALEGVMHEPHLVLYIALQRVLGSHYSGVEMRRLQGKYLTYRLGRDRDLYKKPALFQRLYGLATNVAPNLPDLQQKLIPFPDSGFDRAITYYGTIVERWMRFLKPAPGVDTRNGLAMSQYRPTLLGILFMAGVVIAFFRPYRSTLGAWTLILAIYLILVFCVGSLNTRFLLPAEPLAILLLLLPLDALRRWWPAQFRHVTARSTA
jgi:hypothetical protein